MIDGIEITLDDSSFHKISIKNDIVEFDNDYLKLAAKVSDLKIVEYLTLHALECENWSVALESSATEKLLQMGVEIVSYKQSPVLQS